MDHHATRNNDGWSWISDNGNCNIATRHDATRAAKLTERIRYHSPTMVIFHSFLVIFSYHSMSLRYNIQLFHALPAMLVFVTARRRSNSLTYY